MDWRGLAKQPARRRYVTIHGLLLFESKSPCHPERSEESYMKFKILL